MLDLDYVFADPDPQPDSCVQLRVEDLPCEWRVAWEERAAVMQYDGGIPRDRAEAIALTEILRQMQRNSTLIPP